MQHLFTYRTPEVLRNQMMMLNKEMRKRIIWKLMILKSEDGCWVRHVWAHTSSLSTQQSGGDPGSNQ